MTEQDFEAILKGAYEEWQREQARFALRAWNWEEHSRFFQSTFTAAIRYAVNETVERCAAVANAYNGGFTANIRTSEYEPDLVRADEDTHGPWGFMPDVAKAIRALIAKASQQ